MSNVKNKNKVTIRGVIVHKYHTDNVTFLKVVTGNGNKKDYPNIVFLGEEGTKVDQEFNLQDHVTIEATIRSRRRLVDGKKTYPQEIYGQTINFTEKICNRSQENLSEVFGQKPVLDSYPESKNEVYLFGEIVWIRECAPGLVSISIRTQEDDEKLNIIQTYHYTKNTSYLLNRYDVGDFIGIIGNVQTKRKLNENNEPTYYEDVIIHQITKFEDNTASE